MISGKRASPRSAGAFWKMAKVLKVLKVLNFSGTGKTNIFTCTFTFTGVATEC